MYLGIQNIYQSEKIPTAKKVEKYRGIGKSGFVLPYIPWNFDKKIVPRSHRIKH